MAIRKFRTLAEAGKVRIIQPGTPEFTRALHAVFRLAAVFAPPQKLPPGVHKFQTIEQAQAQKMAWLRGTSLEGGR